MTIDLGAERQALREVDQAWADAGSVEQVERFPADDIVVMPQGMWAIHGKEGTLEFYRQYFESAIAGRGGPERVEVSSSGDLGYTIGRMWVTMHGEQGPIEDDLKYVAIYRKQGQEWKGAAVIFNSNPAPG